MRFTLQNVLVLWAIVAGFCILNGLLGEWPALEQFLLILGVVFGSGFWALWWITKENRGARGIPSTRALLLGIRRPLGIALLLGLIFETQQEEICVKTQYHRTKTNFWLVRSIRIQPTEEALFIERELGYKPAARYFVPKAYPLDNIIKGFFPQMFPQMELEMDDLRALSALRPVEKCHSIFEMVYPLDQQYCSTRGYLILVWVRGVNPVGVEEMWADYGPLLRPWSNTDALRASLEDFMKTRAYAKSTAYWNSELQPLFARAGIGPRAGK